MHGLAAGVFFITVNESRVQAHKILDSLHVDCRTLRRCCQEYFAKNTSELTGVAGGAVCCSFEFWGAAYCRVDLWRLVPNMTAT